MSSIRSPLLPRETRDTWLVLAAVTMAIAPQMLYLPLWTSALAAAILMWRFWAAAHQRSLPATWLRVSLLVLCIAGTALQFRTIVGPDAGVVLAVLLLVLKTMEMRARRDAMVIFFLGFFTLLSLLLQSQELLLALNILLALWLLLAALVNAYMPAGYPSVRRLLGIAGQLMLLGAPIMLALFISFPRFAPLWGLPTSTPQGRTGLSNEMTVGQVAELALDNSVAMRVRFLTPNGSAPPQNLLYFRGPVLNQFDGRNWRSGYSPEYSMRADQLIPAARGSGTPISYEVTLQPSRTVWLLSLDATLSTPTLSTSTRSQRGVLATENLQWLMPLPITDVLRYQAQSFLTYRYGLQLSQRELHAYLRLPRGSNPRTVAWAQQLREEFADNHQGLIHSVLTHLRQGGFVYTLQPGAITNADTADDFWFDRQQGFCEHIASAFAVLMRSAGIPARIVTGFQGGENNPVDGIWTVRNSDAHAWTEVWLKGNGWVRVDPTAAVAPARIEQLQRLAGPSSVLDNALGTVMSASMLSQLRANWDAINSRWNDWVISYSSDTQREFLRNLHLSLPSTQVMLKSGGAIAALSILSWLGWRWHKQRNQDPWLHLMAQMHQQCIRSGIANAANLSIRELIFAMQAHWGEESSKSFAEWLLQMEKWRYAPHDAQTPSLTALRHSYRSLIWPPHRTS